jgi:hypothetical protein
MVLLLFILLTPFGHQNGFVVGHTVFLIFRNRFHRQRTKSIVALIGDENDERNNGMYFCCIYYNIWNGSCQ